MKLFTTTMAASGLQDKLIGFNNSPHAGFQPSESDAEMERSLEGGTEHWGPLTFSDLEQCLHCF